jgi:choline dehydrogenase-like flavoprotein
VIIGKTANLTQPVKGRGQCQARDLCHRGCPFGAYFSTNASTMPAAYATGNLTVRPHSLVNKVLYDEQKQSAGSRGKQQEWRSLIRKQSKQKNFMPALFSQCLHRSHCIYIIEFNIITFPQWIRKWK